MNACSKSVLVSSLLLALTACGGGGGGGSPSTPTPVTPTQPPVSEEEQKVERYTAFVEAGGLTLVELPMASVESFFQLASMADARIQQASDTSGEMACEGDSAGEGRGRVTLTMSEMPLTASSLITVDTADCYDPYLLAVTSGSYQIQMSAVSADSWQYALTLNDLTVENADNLIELEGSLLMSSTLNDTLISNQVQSSASALELRLIDGSDVYAETFTNLALERSFDFVAAQRTISGSFTETSDILGETLTVAFSQPFTGAINRYPTAGELQVTAESVAGRIEVLASGTGNYLAPVSIENDGDYYAPETFTFGFDDILEGTLFLTPAPVYQANGVRVYADEGNALSLLDSTGVPEPEGDGSYQFNAGDELVLRFSKPVTFSDDDLIPTLTRLVGDGEDVPLSYSVDGAIVRITLPATLSPSSNYRLNLVPFAGNRSIQLSYYFSVEKSLSLEVVSPVFGFAGESFELNTEVLSNAAVSSGVQWQQMSGPALGALSSQQRQTTQLPAIDSDYEIAVLQAQVTDDNGNTSRHTFNFVIVDPALNQNLIFLPYAYAGPTVLSGDAADSFSRRQGNVYQAGVDTFHQYATASFFTSDITNGDFTANDDWSGRFALQTNSNLWNDESCSVSDLPAFRPGVNARLHAYDVVVGDTGITKGNFVVNRYCVNDDQFHAQYGVLIRDNLFTVEGAGFLYSGSSFPLTITGAQNSEITTTVTPSAPVTVADDLSAVSAGSFGANDAATVTFTRGEGIAARSEAMNVDLIADLSDSVHIYFDRVGWANGANTGRQLHQYSHSLVVSPDEVWLNRTEGGYNINVDVDRGVDDLLASIGMSVSTISVLPVGEKVVIEREGDSDHNVSVSFNNTVCEEKASSFTVHEVETDADNNITVLAMDGYTECMATDENGDEQPGFARMSVRFNSAVPVDPVSVL